jgi:hypothetical protein
MLCPVCQQETEHPTAGYCQVHGRALANLRKAYAQWTIGYGTISLLDFLKQITRLAQTGDKTKETARFLIENQFRWG